MSLYSQSTNLSWKPLLLIVVGCLLVHAFFSMVEMACVSFNRVRLHYYVSKGNKRAIWLNDLLQKPGRLFGTALICINLALQIGSEASRRFYEAVHLDADIAPLTQVLFVLIFAEIAPLFAGLRYAEHAAMIGIPILYSISFLLRPFIAFLDLLCRIIRYLFGGLEKDDFYLSREELQKALEEKNEREFNNISKQIFSLKYRRVKDLMQNLNQFPKISPHVKVGELRRLLQSDYSPFVPIYHQGHVLAMAYPRDLLRAFEDEKVVNYSRPAWFITEKDSIMTILRQFRLNNQSVAVVLNEEGFSQGVLTLDGIIDEVFSVSDNSVNPEVGFREPSIVLDRTFPGDTELAEFTKIYSLSFGVKGVNTLEDLVTHLLGHAPVVGETVLVDHLEFKVEESSFLGGAKSIAIRTLR